MKAPSSVSIRTIAEHLGLSKTTVSDALNHKPWVSKATRERVARAARQLGYTRDAQLATYMSKVRVAGSKGLLPIAWLNTSLNEASWAEYKWLAPYFEGAQERAVQTGYRLEEFWLNQPGMTLKRLSRIMDAQGIEGVVVTYPAKRLALNWERFAAVSLGGALLRPNLDAVIPEHHYNLKLALKKVQRAGYERIGICIHQEVDRLSAHLLELVADDFHRRLSPAQRVPPLFHPTHRVDSKPALSDIIGMWLERHRPDVVIGRSAWLLHFIRRLGYRVPDSMGFVHLATDGDVQDWTGIDSNKRVIGAIAIDVLVSRLQRRDLGPPQTAARTSVRGVWHAGSTLRTPRSG
ncbi:MAG: LacI family DNA-binding transcriptional regulator [Verrucomicrobiota bacterium]